MILYHGVKSLETMNIILSEGFKYFKKGFYGVGVYATSNLKTALEFTNNEDGITNKSLILQFSVDDSLILDDTYKNIANKFFKKKEKENLSFYCMDPLWGLDEKIKNLGYSGCKINYIDTDEVIIFNPDIITDIKKCCLKE